MVVRIRLVGDHAQADLVDLAAWLSREDEFRGRVSSQRPTVMSDEMGGFPDVLEVVLSAQGVGTVLAASLTMWIKHRRPSADVEITKPDGRSVKVSVRDATSPDTENLLRLVLED
jgi:hypothetical protein